MATPAWIKLYRKKLHDFTFRQLPDAIKAHVILIELLASQTENKLPCDSKLIQSAIGADKAVDLALLLAKGFIEMIEQEESSRESLESNSRLSLERSASSSISSSSEYDLAPRPRKKPELPWPANFALTPAMRAYAMNHGIDPEMEFERFRDWAIAHSKTYADWEAGWRTRINNTDKFGGAKLSTPVSWDDHLGIRICPGDGGRCNRKKCADTGHCAATGDLAPSVASAGVNGNHARNINLTGAGGRAK
jgi:hypothetical protein